jgi:hypothetical protein
VVQQANITEQQAQEGMRQADIANTQAMQQKGTLFSGERATQQAQAEAPYLQTIGQTEYETPTTLAGLHSQAASLIGQYNTQNAANLAAAADRYTKSIEQNPVVQPTTTAPKKMQEGGEVTQPTNAVIGENGPESVVARKALTSEENMQLTDLQNTAQARLAGNQTPEPQLVDAAQGARNLPVDQGGPTDQLPQVNPGIHWFGPGGSGVDYPPPLPAEHPLVSAARLYAQGHHQEAINQWMAHHPGVMRGHAQGVPNWVHAAVAARIHALPAGFMHPYYPWLHNYPGPIHTLPAIPEQPIYEGPLGGGAFA